MVREFHPRLYVACSFQKEASVILDMLVRDRAEARFFVLDTGVLFEETYDTWRALEKRYGVDDRRLPRRVDHGLWARDPDACCGMRKVSRCEGRSTAWTRGSPGCGATSRRAARARRSSRGTRPTASWKAAPLADWTE